MVDTETSLTSLHAIVPVRGVNSAKSRLGSALDPEERQVLALGLVSHTLATLAEWRACRRVHVVSDDAVTLREIGRGHPAVDLVRQPEGGGLNAAVSLGRERAIAQGATAVLILPADLPLVSATALAAALDGADAALAAGHGQPLVLIAPSDARGGTNALLLAPPDVIEPAFGEMSLEAHLRSAARADASVQLVLESTLGFDLDTPDDLERLDFARLLELQALGQALLPQSYVETPVEVG